MSALNSPIRLQYPGNGDGHDDIVLTFGAHRQALDSYYLALDPKLDPGDESPGKVRRVLVRLLQQWIERLQPGDVALLPAGFTDQATLWIHCLPDDGDVVMQLAWSDDEGWARSPSDLGEYTARIAELIPEPAAEPVRIDRSALIQLLETNIRNLKESPGNARTPSSTDPSETPP